LDATACSIGSMRCLPDVPDVTQSPSTIWIEPPFTSTTISPWAGWMRTKSASPSPCFPLRTDCHATECSTRHGSGSFVSAWNTFRSDAGADEGICRGNILAMGPILAPIDPRAWALEWQRQCLACDGRTARRWRQRTMSDCSTDAGNPR